MPIHEAKNLNDIPDTGNYIDTPGEYDVLITDVINTDDCVSEKGTDFFVLKYMDATGRSMRDSFYDTDGAMWRWGQLGDACQLTKDQKDAFVPDMVRGKTIHITVAPQKNDPRYMQVTKLSATGITVSAPAPVKDDCPF